LEENMGVIIKPYVGIDFYGKNINFNMSQKEIRKIIGENAPKIEIDNIMEEIREYRSGMIFTYKNKKLLDITFTINVELNIFDIEIFKEENLLEKIKEHDSPTVEGKNGYMNFYKLGICIGGFGKRKIPEKKLVTAFCEERIKFYEFFIKM
jgi:hypothetical protein